MDAAVTQDVVVVVRSPAQELILTAQVEAVGSASQYTSSLSGPIAGSAVGRLSAARGLVVCGGSVVGSMLPLTINGVCNGGGGPFETAAAKARGTVIGNLLLWVTGCMLMAVLVYMYANCAGVAVREAAEALGVPSPLLPLVVVSVPSTASSTFVLLRSSCSVDSAIGSIGVVMCVCPIAVLCRLSLLISLRLHRTSKAASSGMRRSGVHDAMMRLLRRRWR